MKSMDRDRADKLWEAWTMTHMKKDYRNAPGVKKLGLTGGEPVLDHRNRELMVRCTDAEGNLVLISREEAMAEFWFPTPAQIEERKRECDFLFPNTRKRHKEEEGNDDWSVPTVTLLDSKQPNSPFAIDY